MRRETVSLSSRLKLWTALCKKDKHNSPRLYLHYENVYKVHGRYCLFPLLHFKDCPDLKRRGNILNATSVPYG